MLNTKISPKLLKKMGFPIHENTPKSSIFLVGIFHETNHPAIGPPKELGQPDFWQSLVRLHHLPRTRNWGENGENPMGFNLCKWFWVGKTLENNLFKSFESENTEIHSIDLIFAMILTDIEWSISCFWTNYFGKWGGAVPKSGIVHPKRFLESHICQSCKLTLKLLLE